MLSETFEAHLNALRQVDEALSRIGRNIAYAQGDPSLQAFWCGVRRDFEQEAHRIALRIGDVATRLSPVDPQPKRPRSRVPGYHTN